MEGFFPSEIVALSVPVESCRGTTGDRDPLGDDLGEYCSTFEILNGSAIISSWRRSSLYWNKNQMIIFWIKKSNSQALIRKQFSKFLKSVFIKLLALKIKVKN